MATMRITAIQPPGSCTTSSNTLSSGGSTLSSRKTMGEIMMAAPIRPATAPTTPKPRSTGRIRKPKSRTSDPVPRRRLDVQDAADEARP